MDDGDMVTHLYCHFVIVMLGCIECECRDDSSVRREHSLNSECDMICMQTRIKHTWTCTCIASVCVLIHVLRHVQALKSAALSTLGVLYDRLVAITSLPELSSATALAAVWTLIAKSVEGVDIYIYIYTHPLTQRRKPATCHHVPDLWNCLLR